MRRYVVLDGPDGCGKTAQAQALADWLRANGHDVLHVREPGSTAAAERIRALLLDPATGPLLPASEALLFTAARAELVHGEIVPALAAGRIVVAERCYLSTAVYQGYAPPAERRVELRLLRTLAALAHGEVWPARIFVLDVPLAVARARRSERHADRIEQHGDAYDQRVHDGFRSLASDDPYVELVDASGTFDSVQLALRRRVVALLGLAS